MSELPSLRNAVENVAFVCPYEGRNEKMGVQMDAALRINRYDLDKACKVGEGAKTVVAIWQDVLANIAKLEASLLVIPFNGRQLGGERVSGFSIMQGIYAPGDVSREVSGKIFDLQRLAGLPVVMPVGSGYEGIVGSTLTSWEYGRNVTLNEAGKRILPLPEVDILANPASIAGEIEAHVKKCIRMGRP